MASEDALKALSSAIENGGETPPLAAEQVAEDTSAEETPAQETAPESTTDVNVPAGTSEAENTEAAEGEQKPEATKPAEGEKPAEAAKPAEGGEKPKVKDPVNDPIGPNTKPETRERIQALITNVKTVTTERDALREDRDLMVQQIVETGATVDQYTASLGYLKLVNSQNPADWENAYKIMSAELEALSTRLGRPIPGQDNLAGHADLQEAVRDGAISQQHAEELAAGRRRGQYEQRQGQQRTQQQQEASAQQQAVQAGVASLNALEAELKTDPHFAHKRAILVETLKPVFAQINPSQWASTFRAAYAKLPNPAPVARPAAQLGLPKNQPLRGTNPAGGAKPAISSSLDALNAGIASAGK